MGNGIHYSEPKKWVNSNLVGNLIQIGLLVALFVVSLVSAFLFLPRG